MTAEKIAKTLDLDTEDIESNLEYWLRSMVYAKVSEALDLDVWLYHYKNASRFNLFALNGLVCSDMQTELYMRALKLVEKGRV